MVCMLTLKTHTHPVPRFHVSHWNGLGSTLPSSLLAEVHDAFNRPSRSLQTLRRVHSDGSSQAKK